MVAPHRLRLTANLLRLCMFVAIPGALLVSDTPLHAAPARGSEEQCIRILQSDAPPGDKDAACVRLKRIGTAASVPALAALLPNKQLSHSARLVLEAMSAPEAGRILIDALGTTAGPIKAGIATSLGVRRESGAVSALSEALSDGNDDVAAAAAVALGEIASHEAIGALQIAGSRPSGPGARAAIDALLRSADRLLSAGKHEAARPLFQQLHAGAREDFVRAAAFRGILLTAGAERLKLACDAIVGAPGPDQAAALQALHDMDAPGATLAFAQLLPRVTEAVQTALIEGLAQRNDPGAAPAIALMAASPSPAVRMAAFSALGSIADDASVALLAAASAGTTGAEQTAARDALVALRRGRIAEALLGQLTAAPPAVQTEVARALAARRERAAVPRLGELARTGSESARPAAVLALARLGIDEPAAFAALVDLVVQPRDEPARAEASAALHSVCQHIHFRQGRIDPAPLLHGLARGSTAARIALLPVCARVPDPQVGSALRAAAADANPKIRDAAVQAMCESRDAQLLPDLLHLTTTLPVAELRHAAAAATVRLAIEPTTPLSNEQRIETLEAILAAAPDVERRRLVLSGLGDAPELGALRLVAPMLDDSVLRDEAAVALINMSPFVADSGGAAAILQRIRSDVQDASIREAADLALRQSGAGYGLVTSWQVAAPFRQTGRDYAGLFDVAFRPESAEARGPTARWTSISPDRGMPRPWLVDLRSLLGTEASVGYARTQIHSDRAQPVRLEFGSDSAVKIWLNGTLMHAGPQARPMRANAYKIAATLDSGSNALLVKIVQPGNAGLFALRVLQPDGAPLEGVHFDPGVR